MIEDPGSSAARGVALGRLDGSVALITGGAQGLGEADARLFVQLGATVVVGDVQEELGRSVVADLRHPTSFRRLDVTSEEDWQNAVADVVARFGRLDVLVNNAGITAVSPLAETGLDDYRRVIEVNQVGVFLGMRAVIPAMRQGSSIINVSSTAGLVGEAGAMAYVASKWAVRGMTKAAALELAPMGIRVNSIHPGAIATPMTADPAYAAAVESFVATIPAGRLGTPEDVARLAAFLASGDSPYCNGSEFVIDGGSTAGRFGPGQ